MKCLTYLLVCMIGSATAFIAPTNHAPRTKSTAVMAESMTRKTFFGNVAAAAFSCGLALTQQPGPAMAAKYGSFGAGSPEVLDPTAAEVDRDILGSESVQKALAKVKSYQSTVKDMQKGLESDPQLNLRSVIIKELDFAKLRDTLNTLNTAFDEDTQRGTDRLIRVIIQDITELEIANTQKNGVPRSPRRLEIMNGKLAKLDQAFSDYLAFAK